jgi:hypothetical protein
VTVSSPDFGQLQPMIEATNRELEAIGVTETPVLSGRLQMSVESLASRAKRKRGVK